MILSARWFSPTAALNIFLRSSLLLIVSSFILSSPNFFPRLGVAISFLASQCGLFAENLFCSLFLSHLMCFLQNYANAACAGCPFTVQNQCLSCANPRRFLNIFNIKSNNEYQSFVSAKISNWINKTRYRYWI